MHPSELAIHLESSVVHHLRIACDFSMKLFKENTELNKIILDLQKENAHFKELLGGKSGKTEPHNEDYVRSLKVRLVIFRYLLRHF